MYVVPKSIIYFLYNFSFHYCVCTFFLNFWGYIRSIVRDMCDISDDVLWFFAAFMLVNTNDIRMIYERYTNY